MKSIDFVEQIEKKECGLACLVMIFNYLEFNISLNELRREFPAPKSGLSFHNMVEICKYYNLKSEPYKISKDNIVKLETKSIPLPAIIQWDKGTHFVILKNISKSYVDIIDPSLGELRVDREDFINLFTGNILYIDKTSDVLPSGENKKNKFIFDALKPNISILLIIFAISGLLQLFNTVPQLMLAKMIDRLSSQDITNNIYIIFIIIVLSLFSFLAIFIRNKILILLQNKIDFSVMTKYFYHFLRLPISFFENRQKGELIYRANLLTKIRDIISTHFIGILLDFSLIIVYLVIMLRISIEMGLLMIILGCIIILILMLFTPISYKLSKRVLIKQNKMQEYISEIINNIYDIKSYALEENTYGVLENILVRYLNSLKENNTLALGIDSFLYALKIMQSVIVFFIGSYFVESNQMTIGTLVAFIFISESFIEPIFSLCSSYFSLTQISSIFQRIDDVLEADSEHGYIKNNISPSKLQGKIEFRNVSFYFNKFESKILNDVSFIIYPGETIWLKGDSGAGKSTILKLILGIYKVTDGQILIDDIPIDLYDIYTLRNSISTVLQENKLFNKSIVENITLESENIDYLRFCETVYDTNLDTLIDSLETKEETLIAENGYNFSGGQIQKILIARALYKNSKILLLDEATNSLDKTNEDFIMDRISMKNMTKIIVTHDDNTIKVYDKQLLLSDKKITVIDNCINNDLVFK